VKNRANQREKYMKLNTRIFVTILFGFGCLLGTAEAQLLRTRVMRSVEVSKVNEDYVVRVEFATRIQYLSHIPPNKGKEVKISLGAPTRLQELGQLIDQERISPHGVKSPLDDVLLDLSNPSKPLLIIQFTETVNFEVSGGSDFRSVTITFRPTAAAAREKLPAEQAAPAAPRVPAAGSEKSKIGRLYNQAREAYVAGNYTRAIQLATSAVEQGTPAEYRDALELLGMAREAKGQLAHATAEYERYIELYGKTEDVSRVKQRLDAILTAALPAVKKRPEEKGVAVAREEERGWRYQRSGGASIYYNNDRIKIDDKPSTTTRSSLLADANFNTRTSRADTLFETRFTGSYEYDLTDDPDNIWRINEAYVSWKNQKYDARALLGRESRSTDGLLGRYDGLRLSKALGKKVKLNLTAGFPVESTKDAVDTDRPFYGVGLDLGNFYGRWDFNVYYIERRYEGLTDRRAVGGEFRYFNNGLSMFGLVDYDIVFNKVNTALLLGNWVWDNSTVFFNVDHRSTPSLAARNALFGQGDTTIDDLRNRFTDDEIDDLAVRHTAESTFATMGYTRTLNPKHQISIDATASKISDIEGSEFYPASPGTATEYYYNLQWITNSIFKPNDNYIFGMRYEDLDRLSRYTILLNARVPVGKHWRLNPKLSVSTSETHDGLDQQDKLKASFNVIYRFNRDTEFEAEAGTEQIKDKGTSFSGDTKIWYFFGGFRKYF